jgi:membrane fusion protein, heavy metal efflux system
MKPQKRAQWFGIGSIVIVVAAALGAYYLLGGKNLWPFHTETPQAAEEAQSSSGPPTVELSGKRLDAIKLGKIATRSFRVVKPAVGSVDFNQDRSTQVSSPYQGRILQVFVALGDRVASGAPLFSIESTDLMTAEATLIQTAGVLELADANLVRLRGATKLGGTAQKDLDQAISDQKTAEGNYRSARLAVAVFGKSENDIDQIVSERKVDRALVVNSPVAGVVSARTASPGQLIQPGAAPFPVTVSDDSSMWLNAYVTETDASEIRVGDAVVARVPATANTPIETKVIRVGLNVDPNVRRLLARADADNGGHGLRAGMLATFAITLGEPVSAPSIPAAGLVRQGDGSMAAYIQKDETHFEQRLVKVGILQDGAYQILDGLKAGDPVVVDGAIFVDNILNAGPSD